MLYRLISLVLVTLFVSACGESADPDAVQADAKKEIAWFNGEVDEAFELAKTASKPLFLYWGAVWCPPCQEIKHTVFKSRRFIAQTDAFVPVYLDGDTEAAQSAGEQFGVKGYPTMIVFNSDGVEVTRIPGGIDISQYNDVLATALESITPTSQLVATLSTNPDALTEPQLKQLAYYSWGQDYNALPEDYDPQLFLTASKLAQDQVSSSRLYMQYLVEVNKAQSEATDKISVVPGALERVTAILNSKRLVLANWDTLAYGAAELPVLITAEPETLKNLWQTSLIDAMTDTSLSTAEQLGGLLPRLQFHFEEHEVLTEDLRILVLKATEEANKATQNSFARQSVVNQINYILQEAKLYQEAKSLLLAELDRSKSPYYFMSSLAGLAEKQEDITTALAWRKKAFETSVGSATRFQWGANYVRALLRLTPEDDVTIGQVSVTLLEELSDDSELFSGRNFRVLRSLNKALVAWQEEREIESAAEFIAAIDARCLRLPENTQSFDNCRSLSDQATNIEG